MIITLIIEVLVHLRLEFMDLDLVKLKCNRAEWDSTVVVFGRRSLILIGRKCQIACIGVLPDIIAKSVRYAGPTVSDSMHVCCYRWIHRTCYLTLLDGIGKLDNQHFSFSEYPTVLKHSQMDQRECPVKY